MHCVRGREWKRRKTVGNRKQSGRSESAAEFNMFESKDGDCWDASLKTSAKCMQQAYWNSKTQEENKRIEK